MSLVLRLARRLAHPRNGVAWLAPVVAVTVVVVLLHSVLDRVALPEEGARTVELGGYEAAVLVGPVSGVDPAADVAHLTDDARSLDSTACVEVNTILPHPQDGHRAASYSELHGCGPDLFGWTVVDGRLPTVPGEVAVHRATGLAVGDTLPEGMLPGTSTVVGVMTNRWIYDAYAVIAAPGAWDALGWPEVAARFPRLSAAATVYLGRAAAERFAEEYTGDERGDGSHGERPVVHVVGPRTSMSESNPIVYAYPATVLALAAAGIVIGLRAPVRRRRKRLLVAQGLRARKAALVAHLADAVGLTAALVVGIVTGVFCGIVVTPLAATAAGHDVEVLVPALDPAVRTVSATVLVISACLAADLLVMRDRPRRTRDEPRARTARHVTSIVLAGLGTLAVLVPTDLAAVVVAVVLVSVAVALVSPEIVGMLTAAKVPMSSAGRLALRRTRRLPAAASVVVAAALVAVGPGTCLLTMVATQVAADNAGAVIPPRAGQVLYYPGDPATDATVDAIIERHGTDVTRTTVLQPVDAGGMALVATDDGLGKVSVVADVADLELLGGTRLDAAATAVLEQGGVLWTGEDHGPRLVRGDLTKVPLPSSIARRFDERWARDSEGFILTRATEALSATVTEPLFVYSGIGDAAQSRLPQALSDAGLDRTLVRLHRPGDAYSIDPVVAVLLAVLAALAAALFAGAARGRVASLRSQASHLAALGVPRSWVAGSLAAEIVTALLAGATLGMITSVVTSGLGLVRLGLDSVVPVGLLVAYLGAVAILAAVVVAVAVRSVRVAPTED